MAEPTTGAALEPGALAEQLRVARQARPPVVAAKPAVPAVPSVAPPAAPSPPEPTRAKPPQTPIGQLVPQVLRTAEAARVQQRTAAGAPVLAPTPETILSRAATREGVTPEELRGRAEAEGVDIDSLLDEVSLGRGADDVLEAARKRGAYGLLPSDEARDRIERLKREHLGLAKELKKPPSEVKTRIITSDKTAGILGVEEMPEEMSRAREAGGRAAWQILSHDPDSIVKVVEFFKDETPTPLIGWSMVQKRGSELRAREEQSRASRGDTTPLSPEELRNIAHVAASQMQAARIQGLHDHPIFLPSTLDPDEVPWSDILKKNVEVVGLAPDETGQVGLIVRPVSTTRHIFEVMDLPQSAAVNLIDKATKGEVTSLSDVATAMRVGMAQRRDFMTAAMAAPWARVTVREPRKEEKEAAVAAGEEEPREIREGGYKPWLALGLGLPAAVLFPDLTLGFAKAATLTSRAARLVRVSKESREAVRLLTEGARAGLEASRLDEVADAARLSGRADEAERLAEDAYRQHAIAQAADAKLRALGQTVVGEAREAMGTLPGQLLDQADQAVGLRLSKEAPDLLDTELAASLPGDLGLEMASVHPMVSRASIRETSTSGDVEFVAGASVVYGYERKLRELRKLSAELRAAGDQPRAVLSAKNAEKTLRKLVDTLDPKKVRGDVGQWENLVRDSFEDAVRDPKTWSKARKDEIRKLVPGEDAEAKAIRARSYRLLGGISAIARRVAVEADPVNDVERAIEAVKASAESRTAARVTLRSVLAKQGGAALGGAFLEPLEVTARGRRAMPVETKKAAKATPRTSVVLSKPAQAFAKDVKAAFGTTDEEADAVARLLDARAETAVEMGAEKSVEDWWKAQGLEVRRREKAGVTPEEGELFQQDETATLAEEAVQGVETIQGKLGADMGRLIDLLGAKMYSKPIIEVTTKELLQNGFDAVKSARAVGKQAGEIFISLNELERTIEFIDDGIGMDPGVLQRAFFTIGGTAKEALDPSQRSGGLGLAKMAFLFGSEWVEVETIKDGVRTYTKALNTDIRSGTFAIETGRVVVDESDASDAVRAGRLGGRGTRVKVRIPESYRDVMTGEVTPIDWPTYSPYILHMPLLGDVAVTLKMGNSTKTLPIGRNWPGDTMPLFTRASTSWGSMDVYVNPISSRYPDVHVLSSGLHQFSVGIQDFDYNTVIDVHPRFPAEHPHYPFNNQREGFQSTVADDIQALKLYLRKYAEGRLAQETAETFASAVSMDKVPIDSIGGDLGAARAAILRAFEAPESRVAVDAVDADDLRWVAYPDEVFVGSGRVTAESGAVLVQSEHAARESFQAERAVLGPEAFFGTKTVDPERPLLHNNTNVDFVGEFFGRTATSPQEFFSEMGSIVVDFKKRLAATDRHFRDLDTANLPYAAGVSIDKTYRGVHVKVPYMAFFLNPLAHGAETPIGVGSAMLHTLMHEAVHTIVPGHDGRFTIALADLYGSFSDTADLRMFEDVLAKSIARHWDTFTKMRSRYDEFSTQNRGKSIEGVSLQVQRAAGREGGAGRSPLAAAGGGGAAERTGTAAGGVVPREPAAPDAAVKVVASRLVGEGRVPRRRELFATTAGGEPRASILFKEGRAVITAFKSADVSSIVHETGHLFRRDLERVASRLGPESAPAKDLDVLAKWAGAGTEWTTEAEEKVALAFERYLRDGKAPVPELQTLFQRFKDFLTRIYQKLVGSPIADDIPDGVRTVFDNLLAAPEPSGAKGGLAVIAPQAPPSEPLPLISRLLRKETLGTATPGAAASEHLAREALRLGATVEGLEDVKDVETLSARIADKVAGGEDVVFSKPVLVNTTDPSLVRKMNKNEAARAAGAVDALTPEQFNNSLRAWSPAQVMDFEDELVDARLIDASNVDKLPFAGLHEAVSTRGMPASARLEQALHGPELWKKLARINLYLFFGGNAEAAMISLPPWLRQGVKAATRPAILSIGEAVRLTDEGDVGRLISYMGGEQVKFDDGSLAKGAVNATTEIGRQAGYVLRSLDEETQRALGAAVRLDDVAFARRREEFTHAIHSFLYGVSPESYPDGLKLLRQALGVPAFEKGVTLSLAPSEHRLARALLVLAGSEDARIGAGVAGDLAGRGAAAFFFNEMHRAYGAENALRASVAAVAVGAASKAMKTWAGLGATVDEAAMTAYKGWLMGEKIPEEEMARVIEMAETFGMDPHFVQLNPWAESGVYVPKKAKDLLWSAVNASVEDRVGKMVGIANRNASDAIRGVLRFTKSRQVRGGAVVRSRYFTMGLLDHFAQLGTAVGIRSAAVSAIRLAPQNLLTMAGGLPMRLLWLLSKIDVVDYATTEKIRRGLQKSGDAMAHAAGAVLRVGKYHTSLDAVLEGGDTVVRVGNHVTTAQRLRDTAVQEGIFSNYHTAELTRTMQSVLRIDGEKIVKAGLLGGDRSRARRLLGEMYDSVGDIAEAWAERERLGGMLTLIESGADPRAAARLVVHGLFDYGGSMSSVDRSLLVGVVLPYWAFQKNADRLIIDALFSPWAAYRLGAIRRFGDLGPEGLGNIFYDKIVEPYGVDLDALLPDQLDRYWAFRTVVEQGYGLRESWTDEDRQAFQNAFGPWESLPDDMKERIQFGYGVPGKVPEDVRRAMWAILSGQTKFADEGLYYLLSSGVAVPGMGLQRGAVPRPRGRALRRGWQRDTPAIPLTIPARGAALEYMNIKGSDHTYYELTLPEPVVVSAFRQGGAVLGAELLVAMKMADALGFLDDGGGASYVSPFDVLSEAVDPYRAMLAGEVLTAYNDGLTYNRPLAPDAVSILERLLPWTLPRSKAPIEDPDLPGKVYQRGTAVLPAAYAFPFDNSPLGEANRLFLDWNLSAFEGAVVDEATAQVRVSQAARILLGLKTAEVSEDILARAETPRRTTTTTSPDVRKP